MTGNDLRFIDLDIDTKPENIHYNYHAIPNGELVMVENPSKPVFQFTQQDLDEEQILFKHLGANFGRIMLWVSDGQYFVSTELKVRASAPFVKVVNNTGIIVQRGDSSFISSDKLSIETNVNANGDDILYRITKGPKFGEIRREDLQTREFTDADLRDQKIEYKNTKSQNSFTTRDSIKITVEIRSRDELTPGSIRDNRIPKAKTQTELEFHVFPESYWDPLEIVSNNSLLVEESTSIAITQTDLQVSRFQSFDGFDNYECICIYSLSLLSDQNSWFTRLRIFR